MWTALSGNRGNVQPFCKTFKNPVVTPDFIVLKGIQTSSEGFYRSRFDESVNHELLLSDHRDLQDMISSAMSKCQIHGYTGFVISDPGEKVIFCSFEKPRANHCYSGRDVAYIRRIKPERSERFVKGISCVNLFSLDSFVKFWYVDGDRKSHSWGNPHVHFERKDLISLVTGGQPINNLWYIAQPWPQHGHKDVGIRCMFRAEAVVRRIELGLYDNDGRNYTVEISCTRQSDAVGYEKSVIRRGVKSYVIIDVPEEWGFIRGLRIRGSNSSNGGGVHLTHIKIIGYTQEMKLEEKRTKKEKEEPMRRKREMKEEEAEGEDIHLLVDQNPVPRRREGHNTLQEDPEILFKKLEKRMKIEKASERRIKEDGKLKAFIVGQNMDKLLFPYCDAKLMTRKLEEFGYECYSLISTDPETSHDSTPISKSKVEKEFRRFVRNKVNKGDKVVFFFSGHGHRREGKNYLLFAKADDDDATEDRCCKLSFFVKMLKAKGTTNIILLDCCQDDPSEDTWKGGSHMDPIESVGVSGGQFVFGFACLPGLRTKEVGGGVFTNALLQVLSKEEEAQTVLRKANLIVAKKLGKGGMVTSTALEEVYF